MSRKFHNPGIILSNSEGELVTYLIADSKTITRSVHLLIVSRCLERIADHAINIAEDVIDMIDAKIIKHHADAKSLEAP